ncbi:hypothetical protein MyNCGM683_25530 [Achromobacter xylosoxidans]|jgi:hypothetical protein
MQPNGTRFCRRKPVFYNFCRDGTARCCAGRDMAAFAIGNDGIGHCRKRINPGTTPLK